MRPVSTLNILDSVYDAQKQLEVLLLCEEETIEMCNIEEMCKIEGFARFPLGWELRHITLCRAPIFLWLILGQSGAEFDRLVLWKASNSPIDLPGPRHVFF